MWCVKTSQKVDFGQNNYHLTQRAQEFRINKAEIWLDIRSHAFVDIKQAIIPTLANLYETKKVVTYVRREFNHLYEPASSAWPVLHPPTSSHVV